MKEMTAKRGGYGNKNLCSIYAKIVSKGKRRLAKHIISMHESIFQYFCDSFPMKATMAEEMERHVKAHIKKKFQQGFLCEFFNASAGDEQEAYRAAAHGLAENFQMRLRQSLPSPEPPDVPQEASRFLPVRVGRVRRPRYVHVETQPEVSRSGLPWR